MYFLGIDPSTKCTGYCLMDLQYEIIEKGKIETPLTETEAGKISFQVNFLKELLKRHKIERILCEDAFQKINVDTLKKLCRTTGAIMYLARDFGKEVDLIYPSSWRKVFHGSGAASKKDTFNKVVAIYNLTDLKYTKDNDLTDSIGIAWACVDLHKEGAHL